MAFSEIIERNELIRRGDLLQTLRKEKIPVDVDVNYFICNAEPVDAVSRECYDRILAENDAMREMLAQIGKKPGDKMDDVRPVVHGQYIGEADGYADGELVYDMWYCSACGCFFEDSDEKPTYNFCPNCGADMRETGR